MTQGNCGRMAVGTRPDSAARGRTRPPPRPPPPPRRCPPPLSAGLPALPPLPPQPAAGAFGGTASRRTRRREGRGECVVGGAARGARCRASGGGRGRAALAGARHLGLGLPRPRGAPGPPPALAGSFVLLPPTTCLSSGPEGAQRKGRHSRRVSQSASRGAPWGARGGSARVSRPPALLSSLFPLLFCCLYSRTRHSLGCFSPSHLGVCGVDAQREHSKLSPSELGRAECSCPRRAGRTAGPGAASV